MAKPLKNLRVAMVENDYNQKDLSKFLGKSNGYITERMKGRMSFTTTEAYKIMRLFKLDRAKVFDYFPPILDKEVKK